MRHIHTVEYYSVNKKNEILQFATIWMNLEGAVLPEMSETDIHFMISKKYR